ncbi:hypothetical protein OsI_08472 [Oryza sativa Indica Group]|uniref:Uncharacterized protein n=1 Tax=Oryza sativa subsp. indica TaxID=39946 RepID=A2X8B5_ORYSI|nr:hypothetical protein OsI_08472 [Oryza sativa Indica Group]
MRPSVPGVYAYELLLWARKELENLEVVTADDGGGGGGNNVHGDKSPVDGKGEAATPAKRADVSGGQECGVVRVEDVQRVETPAAEITNAMKDTEIVKNKDQERGGSEREEEETVAMAGTGSREEALLVLFDTAWQQGNLLIGGSGGTAAISSLAQGCVRESF